MDYRAFTDNAIVTLHPCSSFLCLVEAPVVRALGVSMDYTVLRTHPIPTFSIIVEAPVVIDVQELEYPDYRGGGNLELPDSILPPPAYPDKGSKVSRSCWRLCLLL